MERLSHQSGVLGILTPVIVAASPCILSHAVTERWVLLKGAGHRQNALGKNGGRNQNERLPDSNCISIVQ